MRILAIHPAPSFSVADVHEGWCEAFRELGVTVASLNLDDRLQFYATAHHMDAATGNYKLYNTKEQAVWLASKGILASCYEFNPDVVFITSGFFVPVGIMEVIRRRGARIVLVHTESPYEDPVQAVRAQYADVNLINDPTNIDAFPQGTYYQPQCYRPSVHHKRAPQERYASDVCFVGTGFQSRIELLEAVDWSGLDLCLAGNWQMLNDDSPLMKYLAHDKRECLDNTDAHDLYASTKVGFNLYRKEAASAQDTTHVDGWAIGPREVEMAAAEVFFIREPRPEGDELFKALPTFTTPEELRAQIDAYIDAPLARETASRRARMAIEERTFVNAAKRLLATLE